MKIISRIVLIILAALGALQGVPTAISYFETKPMIVSVCHYHQLDNIRSIGKAETIENGGAVPKGGPSSYAGVLRFDLMNPNRKEITIDYIQISNVALSNIKGYGISGKTIPIASELIPKEDSSNGIVSLDSPNGVKVLPNDGLHFDLYLTANSSVDGARIDPHISNSSRIVIKDKGNDEGEPLITNLNDLIQDRYDYVSKVNQWKTLVWGGLCFFCITGLAIMRPWWREKA